MVHLLIAGFPGKKSSAAFVAVYGCQARMSSISTGNNEIYANRFTFAFMSFFPGQ